LAQLPGAPNVSGAMNATARRLVCILLLVTAAPVAAHADGFVAPEKDRCVKKGRTAVAVNKQVRVYSTDGETQYFGCSRATGRSARLWAQDGVYRFGNLVRLTDRFVVFSVDSVPACKADCPPGVTASSFTALVDVPAKKFERLAETSLERVLLTRKGSAAWLTGRDQAVDLHVRTRSTPGVKDSGAITALSLKGTTLTYRKDGVEKLLTLP